MDDHNTIMVTWANHHYLDFVTTWVEHIKAVGVTTYLVGAQRCMQGAAHDQDCTRLCDVRPVIVDARLTACV